MSPPPPQPEHEECQKQKEDTLHLLEKVETAAPTEIKPIIKKAEEEIKSLIIEEDRFAAESPAEQ